MALLTVVSAAYASGAEGSPPRGDRTRYPNALERFRLRPMLAWRISETRDAFRVAMRAEFNINYRAPGHFKLKLNGSSLQLQYHRNYPSGSLAYILLPGQGVDEPDVYLFGRTFEEWADWAGEVLAYTTALSIGGRGAEIPGYLDDERVLEYFRDAALLFRDLSADLFGIESEGGRQSSSGVVTIRATGASRQILTVRNGPVDIVYAPWWVEGNTDQVIAQEWSISGSEDEFLAGIAPVRASYGLSVQSRETYVQHAMMGWDTGSWYGGVISTLAEQASRSLRVQASGEALFSPLSVQFSASSLQFERKRTSFITRFHGGVVARWPWIRLKIGPQAGFGESTYTLSTRYQVTRASLGLTEPNEPASSGNRLTESYHHLLRLAGVRGGWDAGAGPWDMQGAFAADTLGSRWLRAQSNLLFDLPRGWIAGGGGMLLLDHPGSYAPIPEDRRTFREQQLDSDQAYRVLVGHSRREGASWPWVFRSRPELPMIDEWFDHRLLPPGVYFSQEWTRAGLIIPRVSFAGGNTRLTLGGRFRPHGGFLAEIDLTIRALELHFRQLEQITGPDQHGGELSLGWSTKGQNFLGLSIENFGASESRFVLRYVGSAEVITRWLTRNLGRR